jgi:hypothetical protein
MLAALSMGMSFCHILQMVPRMRYDVLFWKNTKNMFELFGPSFGILMEGAAILFLVFLLILIRKRRDEFQWTVFGTLCMAAAYIAWWTLIYPVNIETVGWSKDSIPYNWFLYRAQWEYTHAVRAVFQILGFSCILISVLTEKRQ